MVITKGVIHKYITNKLIKRGNGITNPINPKENKKRGKKRKKEKAGWDKWMADLNQSLSVITLNVNCINALMKRQRLLEQMITNPNYKSS